MVPTNLCSCVIRSGFLVNLGCARDIDACASDDIAGMEQTL